GGIPPILKASKRLAQHQTFYKAFIDHYLTQGMHYPSASPKACQELQIHELDVTKPNNIVGLSYVQAIREHHYPITPLTIKRSKNDYHDQTIASPIASATSIREEFLSNGMSSKVRNTMPDSTLQ